jgi:hypothetical protein
VLTATAAGRLAAPEKSGEMTGADARSADERIADDDERAGASPESDSETRNRDAADVGVAAVNRKSALIAGVDDDGKVKVVDVVVVVDADVDVDVDFDGVDDEVDDDVTAVGAVGGAAAVGRRANVGESSGSNSA